MPSLANYMSRRFMKQDFLYWQKTGSGDFGKPTYATYQPLKARWEDKQQEILLPDNRKVLSKGFLMVYSRLLEGSLVFLGTLAQWQAMPTYPTVPTVGQGGREILLVTTEPDLQAKDQTYEIFL